MSEDPPATSPANDCAERATYAAFRLRFRALRIDATICLTLFVIGGLLAGIVFENSPGSRVAVFAAILLVILGYEPFMVARYGGTFGHRKSNIRIVCAETEENLPLWRAAIRSLIKQAFGIVSLVFMFVTSRAQGLHDLASGARVILRDPQTAVEDDRFEPPHFELTPPVPWPRRIAVILAFNALLFVLLIAAIALLVSPACSNHGFCSGSDQLAREILASAWLLLAGFSVVLGWTGRLPGCRPG